MPKCNWSGNPSPMDSFRAMEAVKTVKTSHTNPVNTKPKQPTPVTS